MNLLSKGTLQCEFTKKKDLLRFSLVKEILTKPQIIIARVGPDRFFLFD